MEKVNAAGIEIVALKTSHAQEINQVGLNHLDVVRDQVAVEAVRVEAGAEDDVAVNHKTTTPQLPLPQKAQQLRQWQKVLRRKRRRQKQRVRRGRRRK